MAHPDLNDAPPIVANAADATTIGAKARDQVIDPWSVSAAVDEHGNVKEFDYIAISKQWSTTLIDQALLDRFERLTKHKPHRWLRRGLYFSHRDLDKILDKYERGEPFFLYTGRGPSSDSMHIGHSIPFEFTKWLQDVFDVPLVIMLTDDEKFVFNEKIKSVEEAIGFAMNNADDIIAIGFDEKKTFIYSDFTWNGTHFKQNTMEFAKLLTFNQVRGAFGFNESTNIGCISYVSEQCVAAFANTYPEVWGDDPNAFRQKKTSQIPCLIPCAIDQDPYFRLVRNNCHRMKLPPPRPALLHCKFLTALQGSGGKMSASDPNSAIFMSDTAKQVKTKVNKYAFSGGQATVEEHREKGGNPDVDVSYAYLTYFMEDDERLAKIYADYKKGDLLTGELKAIAIEFLQKYVQEFQERRKKVTPEIRKRYMTPRKLEWKGNPNPTRQLPIREKSIGKAEGEAKKKGKSTGSGDAAAAS